MSYYPVPLTALAESDDDGTGGKNIVAGAVVTATDLSLATALLYDDASGSNPATSKTTGSNGQVNVFLPRGVYLISLNGGTPKQVKVGSDVSRTGADSYGVDVTTSGANTGATFYPVSRTRGTSLSGSPTSGVASLSESSINNDAINAKDAIAGEFINTYVDHIFNGGNGGRSGLRVSMLQSGATTNKADVGGRGPFMKAITGTMKANTPDNGTSGDEYGNLHGGLLRVELETGATDYNAIVGLEINPNIETGASALRRTGLKIVPEANGTEKGSSLDNAMGIVNQSLAAKWDYGFTFGDPTGVWPIESTGTLIYAFSSGGDPITAADGIDLSEVTFSGDAYKSNEFAVDGDGVVRAAGLVFGEASTPSASNTLDRYEEGTWTPTVSFGGGSTGVTYSNQQGSYTVIGDLVFFRVFVQLTSKGTDTGNLAISMPSGQNASSITPATVGTMFNFTSSVGAVYAMVSTSGLLSLKKETATGNTDITDADVSNSMYIIVSGTYKRTT